MIRVCLVGGHGRLGRRIAALLAAPGPLCHHSTLVRRPPVAANPAAATADPAVVAEALAGASGPVAAAALAGASGPAAAAGPPRVTADPALALAGANLVVDVAAPAAAAQMVVWALAARLPYLAAATALADADRQALDGLAQVAPVMLAPNLSVQVAVMMALVETAARQLGAGRPGGPQVAILDLHRQGKRDAPSGTAQALAARVAAPVTHRALRLGEVVGEHTVTFFGAHERLEIAHRCDDVQVFARGALAAAAWLAGQTPGRYSMADMVAS